jgi:hypothetical protein
MRNSPYAIHTVNKEPLAVLIVPNRLPALWQLGRRWALCDVSCLVPLTTSFLQ